MLVLGAHDDVEEDEMYLVSTDELAAQHVAELRRQAERQRLIRELGTGRGRAGRWRRRAARAWWGFGQARPARV